VTPDALAAELVQRAAGTTRLLIGLAGAPGAGKSTVSAAILRELDAAGVASQVVPMDGFHLADATLVRLGRRDRKGALDTFDGHGYLALLRRLREETQNTVYAPGFDRDLEQPVAGAIAVDPEVRIVITEGNYLLVDQDPWSRVAAILDEVLFVDLDDDERRRRLVARHVQFGKAPDRAAAWVDVVDEPNARLVQSTAARASRHVTA
jgi:pantothenate kinase